MNTQVQNATTHWVVTTASAKMDISLPSRCINVTVKLMNIYSILADILGLKKQQNIFKHILHTTTSLSVKKGFN